MRPRGRIDLLPLVAQVVGTYASMIRRWQCREPHGVDPVQAVPSGASNAVHAIHHAAVGSENDRIRHVGLIDQAGVLNHRADRRSVSVIEPVHGIDLVDRAQLDNLSWQRPGQLDESVHVPGLQVGPGFGGLVI